MQQLEKTKNINKNGQQVKTFHFNSFMLWEGRFNNKAKQIPNLFT